MTKCPVRGKAMAVTSEVQNFAGDERMAHMRQPNPAVKRRPRG